MTSGTFRTQIEAAATSAQELYHLARRCGSEFDQTATLTQSLSESLQRVRSEASRDESPLRQHDASFTAEDFEQLRQIIDDCESTLGHLQPLLKKHEHGGALARNDRIFLQVIRGQLDEETQEINRMLDRLPSPSPTSGRGAYTNNAQLVYLKSRIDAAAARPRRRQDSGFSEGPDDFWLQVRTELERENVPSEVLEYHEDDLRAYAREIEIAYSTSQAHSPSPITLHGNPHTAPPHSLGLTPVSFPSRLDLSPKEDIHSKYENEKFIASIKQERRAPEDHPLQSRIVAGPSSPLPSPDTDSSSGRTQYRPQYMSTRDVLDTNSDQDAAANSDMQSPVQSPVSPTSGETYLGMYLPPHLWGSVAQSIPTPSGPTSPSSYDGRALAAPAPAPGADLSNNLKALSLSPRNGPPPYSSGPGQLLPDQKGRPISPSATWTKIKRRLVTLEALDEAGLRYEARQEFVAVLGVLQAQDIQKLANRSADIRREREKRGSWGTRDRPFQRTPYPDDSDDDTFAESDTTDDVGTPRDVKGSSFEEEKSTKSYPIIVSPPEKEETSPTSPASTVKPKPILKNKNENKVHFGSDPWEEPKSIPRSYRSAKDEEAKRERRKEYERARAGDRDRDRDREHREKDRDRDRRERDRDRESKIHGRDRDRERDREREHHRRSRDDATKERDRDRDRERERDRDRDRDRDGDDRRGDRHSDRHNRRKKRNETIVAASLGGAAATLFSAIAETAVEMASAL